MKKLILDRLRSHCLDAWAMYHMVIEHHWKPSEIIKMQPWEVACVMAISERHAKEIDRLRNK